MATKIYDNATAETLNAPANQIKPGTYVKRTNRDGTPQKKVYIMGAWCRYNMGYALQDDADTNREVYVNKDSMLQVGFTY